MITAIVSFLGNMIGNIRCAGYPAAPDMPILRQASRRICNPPSKKCPNLFMLWGICNPQHPGISRHIGRIGGLQIPQLNRSNLFYDGQHIRRDAQRKTALCTHRRKRNIAQHVINAHPEGTRFALGVKIGRKLHVFAHAYAAPRRNLCRPPGRLCRNNIISYKKYIV